MTLVICLNKKKFNYYLTKHHCDLDHRVLQLRNIGMDTQSQTNEKNETKAKSCDRFANKGNNVSFRI